MDYYKEYGARELEIFKKFVSDSEWLSKYVKEILPDNTPLHDLIIITNDEKKFTVEIKEDENYWFSKTGNIGLDYISSFRFVNQNDKPQNLWIPIEKIDEFESKIHINKYGKLITCDADFQFYCVFNLEKTDFLFSKLYDNKKMQKKEFVEYLKSNYRLRINDKGQYKLSDSWESAAFFVNPLNDQKLIECEVIDIDHYCEDN